MILKYGASCFKLTRQLTLYNTRCFERALTTIFKFNEFPIFRRVTQVLWSRVETSGTHEILMWKTSSESLKYAV